MNKTLLLGLVVTLTSAFSFATSMQMGPYLTITEGDKICHIRSNTVIKNINGKKTSKSVKLDANELAVSIKNARKQPLKTGALHMVAKNPPLEHSAGITAANPKEAVEPFVLRKDASNVQVRQGQDAADLIKLMNTLCK